MPKLLKALAAISFAFASGFCQAQAYPAKPVKIIVPYAAGQGTDIAARYIADQLSRALHQNFFVENRAGAGGNIGSQLAAKSPADGYTLLMGTNGTHAAAPFLYDNPGFDPEADFEPIALTGILPLVFVTLPGNETDTVQKLIDAARARPDAINVAVTTTTCRATFQLFKQRAEAPLFPVLYKGSAQAITDLIGGQIEFMVDTITSLRPHVESGKLKAIAVTSLASGRLLPGVKSVAEQGVPGFDISGWNVVYAPKGTPAEAVRILAAELTKIMAREETQQKLLQLGIEPEVKTGDELKAFLRAEREKWGQLIRSANLKVQ